MAVAFRATSTAQTSTAITTLTLAAPAGMAAGDVLIAALSWNGGTITPPSGWLPMGVDSGSANTSTNKAYTYWKYATAADVTAGSFVFTSSVNNNLAGIIAAYSGVDQNNPFLTARYDSAVSTTLTSTGHTQVVAASKGASFVVAVVLGDKTAPTFSTGTSRATLANTGATGYAGLGIGDSAWATPAGSTGPTFAVGTSSIVAIQTISLNPDNVVAFIGSAPTWGAATTSQNYDHPAQTPPTATLILHSSGTKAINTADPSGKGWSLLRSTAYGASTALQNVWTKRATAIDTAANSSMTGKGAVTAAVSGHITNDVLCYVGFGSVSAGIAPVRTSAVNTNTAATSSPWPTLTALGADVALVGVGAFSAAATVTDQAALTNRQARTGTGSNDVHAVDNGMAAPGAGTTTAYTETTSAAVDSARVIMAMNGVNAVPTAPTLTTPANNIYADLAAGYTFAWAHNDPNGDPQASYALRRKIGAGAYEYWNAGTLSWQGSVVYNTTATQSVVFGAGKWTNGNAYSWSVSTADAIGPGPFATDLVVNASTSPVVSAVTPSGAVTTTTRPPIGWTYTDAEAQAQVSYRVRVFTAAQYGIGGFDPATSPGTIDSGTVASAAVAYALVSDLDNGTTYKAYVYATQTGGQNSDWVAGAAFTITLDAPAQPALTATADTANGRITLALLGRDNLLSANDASLETDASGWAADLNQAATYPQRSTAQFQNGAASLLMRSGAAGDMRVRAANRAPIVVGQTYTALASLRAAVSARSARVLIRWYTAVTGGALVSTSTGASVADSTGGWTALSVTAVAPATATHAEVVVEVLATGAASEDHYVDQTDIGPGTSTAWTRGGLAGATTALVEYSDDSGVTWKTLRGAGAVTLDVTQAATLYDYETVPGKPRTYRAKISAVV